MDTVIEITLGEKRRVDARVGEHLVRTDQPADSGGEDSAPTPFALFLASIATCAGNSAAAYCQARDLPTDALKLSMHCRRDEERKRYDRIELRLEVPADFPDRHRTAIQRAIDTCSVKRHIAEPPEFALEVASRD